MALFDFLKKAKDVAEEIAKAAGEAGKDIASAAKEAGLEFSSDPKPSAPQSAPVQTASAQTAPAQTGGGEDEWAMYADTDLSPAEMTAHFDSVIAANFVGQYEKDFSASRLDPTAHPACRSVSYMFMKDGAPALAVVLVSRKNYRGMNVLGTKEIVEKKRIPYMRFYVEMQNREEYVVSRIRAAL